MITLPRVSAPQYIVPRDAGPTANVFNGLTSGISAAATGAVAVQQGLDRPVSAACLGVLSVLLTSLSTANWLQAFKR